jgi:hypothetical protein
MKKHDSVDVTMEAVAEWALANGDWFDAWASVAVDPKKRRAVVECRKRVMRWRFDVQRYRTADPDEVEMIGMVVADRLDHIRRLSDALGPVVGWDGAWDRD